MKIKLSVIIPVYNEPRIINHTLDHLFGLDFDSAIEVIVVDGDPAGATIGRILHKEVTGIVSGKGRAVQMNAGAAVSTGENLLFLHADTFLPKEAFRKIEEALEGEEIAAGAFDLGIRSDRWIFRVIERISSLRSRITRIPYGDQGIFLKSGVFREMGGYRKIPLMEDVALMRQLRRSGGRIRILENCAMTSPRRWEKEGICRCTLRNWFLTLLYFLGVSPERLVKYY